jgi:hypothetical protein
VSFHQRSLQHLLKKDTFQGDYDVTDLLLTAHPDHLQHSVAGWGFPLNLHCHDGKQQHLNGGT